MMSTRSGRTRQSLVEVSPPRTRKGVSPTRSPARNQKSSPAGRSSQKSPSRKSPSRKSPSRKPAPKYPARKSPSRAVKETEEVKESTRSPSKRPTIKRDVEVILEDVSDKVELLRSTRARRIEYSVADYATSLPRTDLPKVGLTSSEGLNGIEVLESRESRDDVFSISLRNRRTAEETAPRRSSRLRDVVDSVSDPRRSLSKSLSKSISQSIASYSDEEDEILSKEKSKSQSVTRKLATPLPSSTTSPLSNRFEFGGRIGATTLYILIPLTVFYILISCSKACSYISLKQLTMHKNISLWFNTPATVLVIGNLLLQTILLSAPVFCTKEVDNKGRRYYFNAFFSSFCTLNILFGLDYYGVLGNNTVLNSYLQMATVSYIVAVILSLIMFLKSREVDENDLNPYGNSGYALYDFFIGRETQVVLLKTNVKLWLARVSNISTLILSILIFKHGFNIQEKEIVKDLSLDEFKNILNKVHFKPTILVYSMMQIIYALYFIMREKKVVSTFYWNSEGLGYMQIVSSALYPFFFTIISKYVADTDLQLTTNTLVAASALYLLGFLIMLISNNIKYEFRKNPLQPSLIHVDSMPTFHGKKLLLSNLWGVVRHPNYAGDILIHAALAIPGIQSRQVIAAAPALLTVATLLHRCWRDHGRCRRRYGAAWTRYCKRVPCVIVPTLI